uniref:C-type lectin domain-containing protein n=1 Tax=Dicentrarchus labrax TaxID=13489 RepID=A0A8P4GH17_DICLA
SLCFYNSTDVIKQIHRKFGLCSQYIYFLICTSDRLPAHFRAKRLTCQFIVCLKVVRCKPMWNSTQENNYQNTRRQLNGQIVDGHLVLLPVNLTSVFSLVLMSGTVRIKVIKQRLNWENAYDYCKSHHTRLLWIQDSKDEEAVGQWLNHTDVTGPFWIGLRQSRVFGFWIWTSDRIVTNNNWENGTQPELPLSNHCGVIKNNFKWSDENCLFQLPFLCEEEIVYMNK